MNGDLNMSNHIDELSMDQLERQLALALPARELMQTLTVSATLTISVDGGEAPAAP
jgi:hypothetical protein